MTAYDQFGIDPDDLRRHATTVSGLADQLATAAGSLPGDLGGGALGSFCEFLAGGLQAGMGGVAEATTSASASVDQISTGLRQTAEAYQRIDDASSTSLEQEYA
ncbi:type VII secretion target [Labedaea rhizosphaerae]|jgi:hypothetical protein|uniref:Excreted virulence factor EspC (Type VII ESX diderm) n=1 Tax=Labedaea rhizosphaerae TaxID=598644 RepID=A0A4R6S5D0_LABRH|nr:type VII secretion target [Labedaea rhizosphaerae]TDP95009.1 excreted virulence factor EspC (type VII ESX diderm) [Labedaea rhizosphaerae]